MTAEPTKLSRAARVHPKKVLWLAALFLFLGPASFFVYPHVRAAFHFHAAEKALAARHLAEARSHLDVCLHTWPRSAANQLLAARIARRAGAYEEADRRLDESQRLHGPGDDIKLERALLQVQQGGLAEHTETLLRDYVVRDHHPESAAILEALAEGCRRNYRIESALKYLDLLLERKPNDAHALLARGWVHERMGHVENARDDYRLALSLEPASDEALLDLAKVLLQMGETKEAVERFEELRRRQPDHPLAALGLAQGRFKLGQIDETRQLLEKLVAKHPRELAPILELGRFYAQIGKPADAANWLRKACELDPHDYQAHYALCQCLRQLGEEADLKAYENRLHEIDGDLKRMNELSDDVQKRPYDLSLQVEMARVFLRNGQEREAILKLENVLKIDARHAPALELLAEYYEKKGDRRRAEEYRRQIRDGE